MKGYADPQVELIKEEFLILPSSLEANLDAHLIKHRLAVSLQRVNVNLHLGLDYDYAMMNQDIYMQKKKPQIDDEFELLENVGISDDSQKKPKIPAKASEKEGEKVEPLTIIEVGTTRDTENKIRARIELLSLAVESIVPEIKLDTIISLSVKVVEVYDNPVWSNIIKIFQPSSVRKEGNGEWESMAHQQDFLDMRIEVMKCQDKLDAQGRRQQPIQNLRVSLNDQVELYFQSQTLNFLMDTIRYIA